jgi:6-phosphogluconolactonase
MAQTTNVLGFAFRIEDHDDHRLIEVTFPAAVDFTATSAIISSYYDLWDEGRDTVQIIDVSSAPPLDEQMLVFLGAVIKRTVHQPGYVATAWVTGDNDRMHRDLCAVLERTVHSAESAFRTREQALSYLEGRRGRGVVHVVEDPEAAARMAAEMVVTLARRAVEEHGSFSLVLSGGSTPKRLYELLATEASYLGNVPWAKVRLYWGDERAVGPDDERSNFRMAREAMLAHVPIPAGNVHRICAEEGVELAAARYGEVVAAKAATDTPLFDLVLLGLGTDGHTASLFPDATWAEDAYVAAVYSSRLDSHRVTLTPRALNAARNVLFLATGADKAPMLAAVLEGPTGSYPAQLIRPRHGRVDWVIDKAAAGALRR